MREEFLIKFNKFNSIIENRDLFTLKIFCFKQNIHLRDYYQLL